MKIEERAGRFKEAFGKAMDNLIDNANENVEAIAMESVKKMTSFGGRNLEI